MPKGLRVILMENYKAIKIALLLVHDIIYKPLNRFNT